MRLFLFALLLANVVMLLVLQSFRPSGLEPERLALQQHAERVTVAEPGKPLPPLPPESSAPSLPSVPSLPSGPQHAPGKCVEAGDFNAQAAAKFEAALASLSLPAPPVRRVVQAAPSQIVLLPPQASEAAAGKRVAQLREQGFKDVSVIRDAGPRHWGISLGVFSKPELADAQLAALKQAGVADARIDEHPLNASRVAYQLPALAGDAADGLKKLLSEFAGVAMRDCP